MVDEPKAEGQKANFPGMAQAYLGQVLVVRYRGLAAPQSCVVIDLGDDTATGAEIIEWYARTRDVDIKGLGLLRLPRTIGYSP